MAASRRDLPARRDDLSLGYRRPGALPVSPALNAAPGLSWKPHRRDSADISGLQPFHAIMPGSYRHPGDTLPARRAEQ